MTAPSIAFSDILAELTTNAATVSGITTYDYFPDSPEVPAVVIAPAADEFIRRDYDAATDETLGYELGFTATVLVARGTDAEAQAALYAFLDTGASSLWDALEDDPSLDSNVSAAEVRRARRPGEYRIADIAYLGFELEIVAYLL